MVKQLALLLLLLNRLQRIWIECWVTTDIESYREKPKHIISKKQKQPKSKQQATKNY